MNNGNWIEEWAKSLGITEPVNGTWIQAIKEYYGGEIVNGTHLMSIVDSVGADISNGTMIEGLMTELGYTKNNGSFTAGIRKGVIEGGGTPPTPTPPSEPTPQGLYWESSIGTTNQSYGPAYGLYDYSTYGTIIKSTEIPAGVELFNKLQFQVGGYSGGYTYNNMTIKMYHIGSSSFLSTTYTDLRNQSVSDETTIWSGDLSITNGWNEITFDTNFEWNGTDGIVILFENRKGSWQSGYGYAETHYVSSNISMYDYQDNSYPTGTTTKTSRRMNIKLGY